MIIKDKKILFEEFPNFLCPKCNIGILRIDKDTVKHRHPSWISKLPENGDVYMDSEGNQDKHFDIFDVLETDLDEYITNLFLKCDNKNCNEVFASCGKSKNETDYCMGNEDEPYAILNFYYYPKMFVPTIRLFQIPSSTPEKIIEELENSFSLFWVDLSSCANSIRKAVEKLIDNIDNRFKNNYLHYRINHLESEYSEIKDILMAIKWIGNDGSHQSDLKLCDVIISFELIEKVLNQLYNKDNHNEIVAKINRTKKPLSKQ